jgi:hypothetical protein
MSRVDRNPWLAKQSVRFQSSTFTFLYGFFLLYRTLGFMQIPRFFRSISEILIQIV